MNKYKFSASKYYFMIFRHGKLVAYTDVERLISMYMRHRNKLQYQVRIYKFKDLPHQIKEKIEEGDWDKELVLLGSYGQCCMTIADENKFIDHIDNFVFEMGSTIKQMEQMMSVMKLSRSEKLKIDKLFKSMNAIIYEVTDNDLSTEEIISYELFEKYLIKLGVI